MSRLLVPAFIFAALYSPAFAAEKNVQNLGIGGGTGICATSISPNSANLMFAATTRGTVFVSRDGGVSWSLVDGFQLSCAQNCSPLFDPLDPKTIYAAAGPVIKVSRDQGKTWQPLLETAPPWKSEAVTLLAREGTGKKMMYAATSASFYRSEDQGKRWRQVVSLSGPCSGIATLATHTFVALGNSVYETVDGGSTWTTKRITEMENRITGFTGGYTKGGRMVLFAAIPGVGVLGSETMGKTWSTVFPEPTVECVIMAPNQDRIAYAISPATVWQTTDGGGLWLKSFGAAADAAMSNVRHSWIQGTLKRVPGIHPRSFSAAAGAALVGTGAELYISHDGPTGSASAADSKTWIPAINNTAGAASSEERRAYSSIGFEANSPWEYYIDPRRRQYAMIAYSDSGFVRSADNGQTWIPSVEGSPAKGTFYNIAFDPFHETRLYAAVSDQPDIPGWDQLDHALDSGAVLVTDDFGKKWTVAGNGLPAKPCTWVTVDPKSIKGSVGLYAAVYGEGVYRSTDGGKTWTSKSDGLGQPGNRNVFMVKVHPKTGEVFCCISGTRKGDEVGAPGGLWRSKDGGDTWENLTAKLGLLWPAGFDLDPRNPTVMYLTANASPTAPSQGGLYKTTTDGTSWQQVFTLSKLPGEERTVPLRCWFVSISPHKGDNVYVSTQDHGIYMSQDGGVNWSRLEWVPCRSVTRVSFPPLDRTSVYISTFGGGVWRGPAAPQKSEAD